MWYVSIEWIDEERGYNVDFRHIISCWVFDWNKSQPKGTFHFDSFSIINYIGFLNKNPA